MRELWFAVEGCDVAREERSSFWTTGIWVMLRYLALPILICVGVYLLAGPTKRAQIHARLAAIAMPVTEAVGAFLGRSEALQARVHVKEPDISADTGKLRLSDLPVAAVVPVVNLSDLPEVEGTRHVNLSDLPEPVDNTVYFLTDKPQRELAVARSIRPVVRPSNLSGTVPIVPGPDAIAAESTQPLRFTTFNGLSN
ncbi:hypothetical protein [Tropicimonas marinistellae]|uniref:hypothetical protein n=1 Tax=Tropicimonas marinistellae TaxID=1739787 RepID=UPI000829C27B|nr:hypothetical protein [Tropicimonas marinistellae]